MPEDINKAYVQKYLNQAELADSEALKNDALYRVGSHLEIIPCNGNTNLTPEQQQTVLKAAKQAIGGD